MNFAEYMLVSAIEHSMIKNCFANIILAGPIFSGKRSIAKVIAEHSEIIYHQKVITIFPEEEYYKSYVEIPYNKFGIKDIDSKSAFDTKRYLEDVNSFIKNGKAYSKIFNTRKFFQSPQNYDDSDEKPSYILSIKENRKINIFTGPHAIDLLQSENIDIPEVISIYVNTNFQKCMERRIARRVMIPDFPFGDNRWEEYHEYIRRQNEEEIFSQKEKAKLVINLDQ